MRLFSVRLRSKTRQYSASVKLLPNESVRLRSKPRKCSASERPLLNVSARLFSESVKP